MYVHDYFVSFGPNRPIQDSQSQSQCQLVQNIRFPKCKWFQAYPWMTERCTNMQFCRQTFIKSSTSTHHSLTYILSRFHEFNESKNEHFVVKSFDRFNKMCFYSLALLGLYEDDNLSSTSKEYKFQNLQKLIGWHNEPFSIHAS